MSRSGSPISPEVRAATKQKCQCSHQRSEHFAVRNSDPKRYTLCRRCTCPVFVVGAETRFPKAKLPIIEVPKPAEVDEEPKARYSICSDCGKSRKCIEGICDACADALVGL